MPPSSGSSSPLPRGFGALFLTLFVDLLGFGIVVPILPFVIEQQGGGGQTLGVILGTYSLMQFLCAPFWGRLSDRVGRRPVLLVSIAGNALSMALMAAFPTFWGLFVGRMLGGVCAANISTAYAYVADVTDASNRSKGMGVLGAGFALGFTLGPAIGGIATKWGFSTPMVIAAGLACVNFVVTYFRLPEPGRRSGTQLKPGLRSMFEVLKGAPTATMGIAMFFFFTIAVSQMEVGFSLHLIREFHWNAEEAGYLAAGTGILMAGVQGGLVGRLARAFGEARAMLGGLLMTGVGFWFMARAAGLPGILAAVGFIAIGRGVAQTTLSSLVSLGAPESRVGLILGFFQSAGSLGRIVGPPIAGTLFDRMGPEAPFYFAALVITGTLLAGWRGIKKSLWERG